MAEQHEREFGRRVRDERAARGLTQAEVARRLAEHGIELHPSAIAKIEDIDAERPRMIRLNEARALAEIFGLGVDDMLTADDASVRGNYEVTVSAFGMTEWQRDALFTRVADAAHARDEEVTCTVGPLVDDDT